MINLLLENHVVIKYNKELDLFTFKSLDWIKNIAQI